ncbi:MAG TPA: gliding motility-associated protein GldE [Chitinophagaceae bacterium]|nr:gliding motility-associated protein GldE [Chitinophagaceae bacterium]
MDSPSAFTEFLDHLSFTLLAATPQGTTFLIIALLALLLLTFVVSGAEVALFSLNNKDVNMLKTKQHAAAKRITDLLEEPKEVYTSMLIAGTFMNICIIVLSNFLFNLYLPYGKIKVVGNRFDFTIEVVTRVIIIAFVIIFFGKILPKVWATQNNLRFAYGSAFIIEALHLLLGRISRWMVSVADGIGQRLGANRIQTSGIQELEKSEEITAEEKNILLGIEKFGNISVKQIMRSRLDVSGIDHNIPFSDLIKKIEELHYSRLPVYKNNLDEVIGILNTKDLIPHLNQSSDFDWHALMRQPYFVPESKLIEDLLRDFQSKHIHFAIVVDEFGGTSGIVTLEDILEEIIGDIKDEFDEEETGNRKLDEFNYVFVGKTMIHDMCRAMKLPPDTFDRVRGDSESIGGLVLELAGEFPKLNDVISCGDFDFTVLEVDKNRILLVKATIKNQLEE